MRLERLLATHAVCRLSPSEPVPDWAAAADGALLAITRTAGELSIVCAERMVPAGLERSGGWLALRVAGPLEHSLVGVLASLAAPLAAAGVPIFAVSTFDTDYLLVPAGRAADAEAALAAAGHEVAGPAAGAE